MCPLLDDEELELDEAALLLTSRDTWTIRDQLTSAGEIQKPKHERRKDSRFRMQNDVMYDLHGLVRLERVLEFGDDEGGGQGWRGGCRIGYRSVVFRGLSGLSRGGLSKLEEMLSIWDAEEEED